MHYVIPNKTVQIRHEGLADLDVDKEVRHSGKRWSLWCIGTISIDEAKAYATECDLPGPVLIQPVLIAWRTTGCAIYLPHTPKPRI